VDARKADQKAARLLDRVAGLTRENRADFESDPALLRAFWADFEGGRFVYQLDRWACPEVECWDSYRALVARIPRAPRPWDCKKATAALAAALALGGADVVIGMRPGERVSHAVLGVVRPGAQRRPGNRIGERAFNVGTAEVSLLDPSVWTGMQPLTAREYEETHWREVKP
jgi:hypothetical protein